ncbi:DEAD/DEAH box helicase [Streptomyces venezuelae]|uniref:DEAD/DEAH box helicase n=1 Tax=Streptomyces venezuelae TaxID=54571 RepID=UPI00341D1DCC
MADTVDLAAYAAGLEVADPPRLTRVVFWRPHAPLGPPRLPAPATCEAGRATVVRPHGAGVRRAELPCWRVPVLQAVPELARARVRKRGHPTAMYWGAVALYVLKLVGEGRLMPSVSGRGCDTWRLAPLTRAEQDHLDTLAAAMPPQARALTGETRAPYLLPRRTDLVRALCDAIADAWPRTAAAADLVDHPVYAAAEAGSAVHLQEWVDAVAAGRGEVRVSLQVDLENDPEPEGLVRVAVRVRRGRDGHLVTAHRVWQDAAAYPYPAQLQAQQDVQLALERGALLWPPLARVAGSGEQGAPGDLLANAEEIHDLLGDAVVRLAAAGIDVLWPAEVVKELTARLQLSAPRPSSHAPSLLAMDSLLQLRWSALLDGAELSEAELFRLASSRRPLVRLRDRWVLVDAKLVAKLRRRAQRLTGAEALRIAVTCQAELDGALHPVHLPAWLEDLRDTLTAPGRSVAVPAGLTATLRTYQQAGYSWLESLTANGLGGTLADDMGLGKTITLLALVLRRLEDPHLSGPTLVVCPASMLGGWQREAARFAPGLTVRRFHGRARTLSNLTANTLVVTTYDTARADAGQLADISWSLVAADEAQHLKNPYSKTAAALRKVSAGAHARVALTGTPVENNLSELWAILDFTVRGLLGSLEAFRSRYARPIEAGQDQDVADDLARLVGPFLLRRLKSDPGIAPELPPKTLTDHIVTLTREQAALYAAVVTDTLEKIARSEGITRRGLVLKLLTALKQICNHPAQYLKEEPADAHSLPGRSGKLALLDELLDVILAEQGAVLIFTQYVAMARLITAHLTRRRIRTQFLHGGTPVADRERMVEAFQNGDIPVFLLSLKAAGTGLTLTRAQHVVHFDRWWNPAVEDQATDRAYRIGQTRPVQVHRMITEGTVEDRIAELLATKRALADAVLGGGEAALTELSDADLADLVRLQDAP